MSTFKLGYSWADLMDLCMADGDESYENQLKNKAILLERAKLQQAQLQEEQSKEQTTSNTTTNNDSTNTVKKKAKKKAKKSKKSHKPRKTKKTSKSDDKTMQMLDEIAEENMSINDELLTKTLNANKDVQNLYKHVLREIEQDYPDENAKMWNCVTSAIYKFILTKDNESVFNFAFLNATKSMLEIAENNGDQLVFYLNKNFDYTCIDPNLKIDQSNDDSKAVLYLMNEFSKHIKIAYESLIVIMRTRMFELIKEIRLNIFENMLNMSKEMAQNLSKKFDEDGICDLDERLSLVGKDIVFNPTFEQLKQNYIYADILGKHITRKASEGIVELEKRGMFKRYDPKHHPIVIVIKQQDMVDFLPTFARILPYKDLLEYGLIPSYDKSKVPGEFMGYAMFWSVNHSMNLFSSFHKHKGAIHYNWITYNRLRSPW